MIFRISHRSFLGEGVAYALVAQDAGVRYAHEKASVSVWVRFGFYLIVKKRRPIVID